MDNKEKIFGAILSKTEEKDGKRYIACKEALAIAAENNVSPGIIGRMCNDNSIKIKNCQLGCF